MSWRWQVDGVSVKVSCWMRTMNALLSGRRLSRVVGAAQCGSQAVVMATIGSAEGEAYRDEAAVDDLDPSETFIERAHRLDRQGHTDAALDLIYDAVDNLLRRGEFDSLNAILNTARPPKLSLDIVLGLLTATLPARNRLPARDTLFRNTERLLRESGDDPGLLVGLDG